ncbi:ATP-dependent DNA helicase PIF1-like protein [Tanacetum coccineum]
MENRLIRESLDFDIKKSKNEHDQLHSLLNPEQRVIYEHVIQSVHNQSGQFYFVYGPGGTGKTFLYKTIISRLRSERMIVLAVASSGIASLLLPGGRTAHSRFIITLKLVENSTCGIKHNTYLAKLLQQVQLIIWDEAPMIQKYDFEALDRTLRDILGYKNPEKRNAIFEGVIVLLGDDSRQILPVIPKGKRAEIVQACINRSELWKSCKESDGAYLKERAILTPRNDDVNAINAYMLRKLPGPTMTYNNAYEVCKESIDVLDQQHLYPAEFLNTLNFSGMPPHALNLKKELPIMLLRNVNPS